MNNGLYDAFGFPIEKYPQGWIPIYDVDLTKLPALTTIDFLTAFTQYADDYFVVFDGATTVGGGIPQLVLANNGVADTGANKYLSQEALGANSAAAAATFFRLFNAVAPASGDPIGHSFEIAIRNVNDTTVRMKPIWARTTITRTAATNYSSEQDAGFYTSANAVTGFRLQLSAGNWGATGSLKVFAMRK